MKDKIIYNVTGLFKGRLTVPSSMYTNIGMAHIARACSAKFEVFFCFWNHINTFVHNEFGLNVKGEIGMRCLGSDGIILTC